MKIVRKSNELKFKKNKSPYDIAKISICVGCSNYLLPAEYETGAADEFVGTGTAPRRCLLKLKKAMKLMK